MQSAMQMAGTSQSNMEYSKAKTPNSFNHRARDLTGSRSHLSQQQLELLEDFERKVDQGVSEAQEELKHLDQEDEDEDEEPLQEEIEEQVIEVPEQPVEVKKEPPKKKPIPQKNHIVVLDKSKNLPPELPPNLVYWNRCETRVIQEEMITNEQLQDFYSREFMHHTDPEGYVDQVSDKPPFFRGKKMWADPRQEKFVNKAEEKILKSNKWPAGMKKWHTEGHIMIAKVMPNTVFFNSKFETANLRQCFKVVGDGPKPPTPVDSAGR